MKTNLNDMIQLRIDEKLKKKLQRLADTDSRKLGDFVRIHLAKLVEDSKNNK